MPKTDRTLHVEYRPLGGLIPYARNARTHSDEQVAQIAASIREFGWTNPILVDGDNGIIAGHGRVLAARKLGMTTVPVIELAGMSEAQKRAYIIADNKLALNAGWDQRAARAGTGRLGSLGFDLSLTGFGEDEIAGLLNLGSPGLTDPDDIPEAEENRSAGWAMSGCSADTAWSAATAPAHRCRSLPRRREAASDGHRSSLRRELRPGMAGAAGLDAGDARHRQGPQRRPRRLAGGMGAVPGRRRLRLAWRAAVASR